MHRLGFIGGGNMAEAIVRAAIAGGVLSPGEVVVADPSPARRDALAALGVGVAPGNAELTDASEQVVFAVKPQAAAEPAAEVGSRLREGQVVASIMAGITTEKLAAMIRAGVPSDTRGRPIHAVRVMPNTPVMVGRGMSGVALGPDARPGDEALIMAVMAAGGEAVRVDESAMDAITAVSGSGPAYAFYLAEAMEAAAAELGLADHARMLVTQTLLGAAELLKHGDDDAAALREKVTSKGGTTEAAIAALDAAGVRDAVVRAVRAAEARGRELGG